MNFKEKLKFDWNRFKEKNNLIEIDLKNLIERNKVYADFLLNDGTET